MKGWKIACAMAVTGMVAACGSNTETQEEQPSAKSADQPADKAADKPAEKAEAEPALEGIAKKGKLTFLRCRSCHTVKKDDVHLTGPNLHGMIDATAGKKEGYAFSEALASSNVSWNDENLDKWIESPRSLVPGNKMVFAGIPKKEDREALIAYLKAVTK